MVEFLLFLEKKKLCSDLEMKKIVRLDLSMIFVILLDSNIDTLVIRMICDVYRNEIDSPEALHQRQKSHSIHVTGWLAIKFLIFVDREKRVALDLLR